MDKSMITIHKNIKHTVSILNGLLLYNKLHIS